MEYIDDEDSEAKSRGAGKTKGPLDPACYASLYEAKDLDVHWKSNMVAGVTPPLEKAVSDHIAKMSILPFGKGNIAGQIDLSDHESLRV